MLVTEAGNHRCWPNRARVTQEEHERKVGSFALNDERTVSPDSLTGSSRPIIVVSHDVDCSIFSRGTIREAPLLLHLKLLSQLTCHNRLKWISRPLDRSR